MGFDGVSMLRERTAAGVSGEETAAVSSVVPAEGALSVSDREMSGAISTMQFMTRTAAASSSHSGRSCMSRMRHSSSNDDQSSPKRFMTRAMHRAELTKYPILLQRGMSHMNVSRHSSSISTQPALSDSVARAMPLTVCTRRSNRSQPGRSRLTHPTEAENKSSQEASS